MRKKEDSLPTAPRDEVSPFPVLAPRSDTAFKDQYRTEIVVPNQICLVHNLITPQNSKTLLHHFQQLGPLLSRPTAPRKGEATRTNERYATVDPIFAQTLFQVTGLAGILGELGLESDGTRQLMGLNSNIRIYRYQKGAYFGPHYDDSVTDPVTKYKSAWTLLIYLTEGDLIGGETSFEVSKGQTSAVTATNRLALIHRHGKDCLLHEGRPVLAGVKWVCRSDLMYA